MKKIPTTPISTLSSKASLEKFGDVGSKQPKVASRHSKRLTEDDEFKKQREIVNDAVEKQF